MGQSATEHGKNFFRSTVGVHPVISGVAIAVLVALVLILVYYGKYWHDQYVILKGKSGFLTQYPYTGLHSNWQLGNGDAGWGGSLQRETTPAQASVFHPGWRPVGLERAICNSGREGLAVGPGVTASDVANQGLGPGCGAGCGPSIPCRPGWDPSATAEAQALATLGSLPHDSNGERSLQGAVNAAFDCDSGLSDNQLRDLMHNGGAP
jgi:hypothetical protein